MQIVIDIPDYEYKNIREYYEKNDNVEATYSYIYHGTPLPKGHGRLIDADALYEQYAYADYNFDMAMEYVPTIIEADKEYETEVINRGNCMMCGKELTEGLFFCKECEEKANSRK